MDMGLVGIGRCGGGAAVGETQNRPFQLSFNGSLKVDFQGTRVTSSETGPFRRAVPRDRAPKPAEALAVRDSFGLYGNWHRGVKTEIPVKIMRGSLGLLRISSPKCKIRECH